MPPKRKSGGGPASSTRSSAQSTLSFSTKKDAATRVTKSSNIRSSSTSKDLASKKIDSIESSALNGADLVEQPAIQVIVPPTEELADEEERRENVDVKGVKAEVITLPKKSIVIEKTASEIEAERISDAQVRRYWKKEEDSRRAARVHQKSLSLPEKILRHFDLSSQYGPCIGISRLKRWKRAESLSLNPPIEVLAVLMKLEEEEKVEEKKSSSGKRKSGGSIASSEGGENGEWRRAYVDELLEGKNGDLD